MNESKFYAALSIAFVFGAIVLCLTGARFFRARHKTGTALYLMKVVNFLLFSLIFFALYRHPDQTKLYYTAFAINAGIWFLLERKKIFA